MPNDNTEHEKFCKTPFLFQIISTKMEWKWQGNKPHNLIEWQEVTSESDDNKHIEDVAILHLPSSISTTQMCKINQD